MNFSKILTQKYKKNCTYLSVHPSVPLAMTGVDLVPTEVTQLEPKTVLPCKFFNSIFFTNKITLEYLSSSVVKCNRFLGNFIEEFIVRSRNFSRYENKGFSLSSYIEKA